MSANTVVLLAEPPHRIDKPAVTRALEKLGPERVLRGHVAFEHGDGGWDACFLAMAFGGFGKLARAINHAMSPTGIEDVVGQTFGLSGIEAWCVMEAFDHCRAEFQVLVEEWLELNYRTIRALNLQETVRLLEHHPSEMVGAIAIGALDPQGLARYIEAHQDEIAAAISQAQVSA
jgi:hypothetical protein